MRASTMFIILPIEWGNSLGSIRIYPMILLRSWSLLLRSALSCALVPLSFGVVIIPSSQRKGLWTTQMHEYWQAVMISFGHELLGGHRFSLVPSKGLHAIIFVNPWLLLPTKSVVAYPRKQSKLAIFKWRENEKEWYWYAGEFPPS